MDKQKWPQVGMMASVGATNKFMEDLAEGDFHHLWPSRIICKIVGIMEDQWGDKEFELEFVLPGDKEVRRHTFGQEFVANIDIDYIIGDLEYCKVLQSVITDWGIDGSLYRHQIITSGDR